MISRAPYARIVEDTKVLVLRDMVNDRDLFPMVLPRGYAVQQSWRVVNTDNFGGDYPNEWVMAEGFLSEQEASMYADAWNAKNCHDGHGSRCAMVVRHIEITYVLQAGFEP